MEQPKKDPQKELEILVSELEDRVDRLRALYEQYFMGYEKLEPSIPRKDVDRRFVHLRKQQIRNTALRFKFNVITQKFQTYSMYWTRICRQIEEGTYKRHVIKANRRFAEADRKRGITNDQSIDVELGDFEEGDLDALLAEVDAEAAAFQRGLSTPDTLPPGAATDPPPAIEIRMPHGGAAIPAGAKPRVVLRRRPDGDVAPGPAAPVRPAGPATAAPASPAVAARPAAPAGPPAPAGGPSWAGVGERRVPAITPARAFAVPGPAVTARIPTPAAPITPNAMRPATPAAPLVPNAVRPAAPTPAANAVRPAAPTPAAPVVRPAAPAPAAPVVPNAARPAAPAPQRIPLPSAAGAPTRIAPTSPMAPATPMTPATPGVKPAGPPTGAGAAPGSTPRTPGTELSRPAIRRTAPSPDRPKKEP